MEGKVTKLRLWGSGTECSLWTCAHMSLFHEELKVLRHLGGQRLSTNSCTSGQDGKSKPIPWPQHHVPWQALRAAPAPSFLGFFLHRTKEDVKTCGTCGHRFGAELLLPKGEPVVPSLPQLCSGEGGLRVSWSRRAKDVPFPQYPGHQRSPRHSPLLTIM